MIMKDRELKLNGSGYYDPTAYEAIKNADKCALKDLERYNKLIHTIFHICELAGFRLDGRITLVDRRTGKIWR